jgi:hypothetical protein
MRLAALYRPERSASGSTECRFREGGVAGPSLGVHEGQVRFVKNLSV